MGMHELAVMDRTGDTKLIWDSDKPDEVENARRSFNELKKKGYGIFHVDKSGEAAKRMHEFDPDAEKLIAIKPIAGG